LLLLIACGPTLTLGPSGWHEETTRYTVAPLDDGRLFTPGWYLVNYDSSGNGFRHHDEFAGGDFSFRRREDDGAMLVFTESLEPVDRERLPEVLADRWIERVVTNPQTGDDWLFDFAPVVPPRETTARLNLSFRSATIANGRTVEFKERTSFTVPGASVHELVAVLSVAGGAPGRGLYLAVAKPASPGSYVVLAYGNSLPRFQVGLDDARSFAHRLRFGG
jgi:hypothetical protein